MEGHAAPAPGQDPDDSPGAAVSRPAAPAAGRATPAARSGTLTRRADGTGTGLGLKGIRACKHGVRSAPANVAPASGR